MALKLRFDLMDLVNKTEKSRGKRKALAKFVKRDFIKREFGNRVIDELRARTQKGIDKKNRFFRDNVYSKQYRNSREFKVFGKTSSPVTLKLTGEMQASIAVKSTDPSGVTIGFLEREQEQKAKGHINGVGRLPVRDFWGMPQKDQLKILKGVISDFNAKEGLDDLIGALSALGPIEVGGSTVVGEEAVQEFVLDEDLIFEDL